MPEDHGRFVWVRSGHPDLKIHNLNHLSLSIASWSNFWKASEPLRLQIDILKLPTGNSEEPKIIVNGRFNIGINTTGFPSGNYSITAKALNGSLRLDEIKLEGLSALG